MGYPHVIVIISNEYVTIKTMEKFGDNEKQKNEFDEFSKLPDHEKIDRITELRKKLAIGINKEFEYSLEDLKKIQDRGPLYTESANPESNSRADATYAAHIWEVTENLKKQGLVDTTEEEKISMELDSQYPDAKPKTIVQYKEKKYQIQYFPILKSRSGKTVHKWGHSWVVIDS